MKQSEDWSKVVAIIPNIFDRFLSVEDLSIKVREPQVFNGQKTAEYENGQLSTT